MAIEPAGPLLGGHGAQRAPSSSQRPNSASRMAASALHLGPRRSAARSASALGNARQAAMASPSVPAARASTSAPDDARDLGEELLADDGAGRARNRLRLPASRSGQRMGPTDWRSPARAGDISSASPTKRWWTCSASNDSTIMAAPGDPAMPIRLGDVVADWQAGPSHRAHENFAAAGGAASKPRRWTGG